MRRWLRIGGLPLIPELSTSSCKRCANWPLFFPGCCFDRQIFQCIVSIITTWTPANYGG